MLSVVAGRPLVAEPVAWRSLRVECLADRSLWPGLSQPERLKMSLNLEIALRPLRR